MVLTLPTVLLFLGQWQNLGGHQFVQEGKLRSLISALTVVKTLQRWDKNVSVLWDCVKKYGHLSEIFMLYFMLWLSFRLWVWHKELHCLNSLSYLFIVICAVLFHDKFPCGITLVELWNSTCVVLIVKLIFMLKMVCFLSFLRCNICVHSWKKCDIKYCVKNYSALLYFSFPSDISFNISVFNNF